MLEVLEALEKQLPRLLADADAWDSVYIDYHPPFVERLWRPWGDYRVNLHRIHPCAQADALFHPHPWPSAMHLLSGRYEMAVGYGSGELAPPVAARILAAEGSRYEMTHPDAWHYVRPLDAPVLTLMVTGKPWGRPSPAPTKKLEPLGSRQFDRLLDEFRQHDPAAPA
jgi:hypothetical protein